MDLFTSEQIDGIVRRCGQYHVINWRVEPLTDTLLGYLGEHLKLLITVESEGKITQLNLFIKCIPLDDKWKADYIRKLGFFHKEYIVLSKVFKYFGGDDGPRKWRPKLLFIEEELFVFENLNELGYKMPDHTKTFSPGELLAVFKSLAFFHARSFIYEEQRSAKQNKPYRIWEEFSEHLQEPTHGYNWRNAGRDAAIELLKTFSKYKTRPDFNTKLENTMKSLYKRTLDIMKPHEDFRNVIVHRDLWANNIFFKDVENSNIHAILIDYQTVLYSSPMLDLSSVVYFNTNREVRERHFKHAFDMYFQIMTEELKSEGLNIESIVTKEDLLKNYYEKSLIFGLAQAGIIVPITALGKEDRTNIFCNKETCHKVNEVSRSEELIAAAKNSKRYLDRVMDVLEEIVERYVYPDDNVTHQELLY